MPLEILTYTLGALDTNCYLIFDSDSREAMIIDPADDGDFLSEQILTLKLKLTSIVLTHAHFDHLLGLLSLTLNFDVPVYMHPKDEFLLKRAQSSAEHWLKHSVDPIPTYYIPLTTNQTLAVGRRQLAVIETPGHTPGSISLFSEDANCVFTGDTLFANEVGKADHKYSNIFDLNESLHTLTNLHALAKIYAGHGPVGTIGFAKRLLGHNSSG